MSSPNMDEHVHALAAGTQLGKFTIEAVLGHGGFGITYLARDTGLDRVVAIKEYLPSDLAVRTRAGTVAAKTGTDADHFRWGLERFMEEARTLARFQHQHIVRVIDHLEARSCCPGWSRCWTVCRRCTGKVFFIGT